MEAPLICPNPPAVEPLKMRPTPPTAVVLEGKPVVFFSFKEYENLGKNLQDILFLVKQQNAVIKYYKDCVQVRPED